MQYSLKERCLPAPFVLLTILYAITAIDQQVGCLYNLLLAFNSVYPQVPQKDRSSPMGTMATASQRLDGTGYTKAGPFAQAASHVVTPAVHKPQRRFQFIDNNDVTSLGSNSTQVRRHVMQEYMREKRWESRSRLEHDNETEYRSRGKPPQKPRTKRVAVARCRAKRSSSPFHGLHDENGPSNPQGVSQTAVADAQQREGNVRYSSTVLLKLSKPCRSFQLGSTAFARLADMWPNCPSSTTSGCEWAESSSSQMPTTAGAKPQPQSALSAARTDPFNCLPMTLNKQEHELFDFYANVMPLRSDGFERRKPHGHNWYHSVLIPEAMKSAITFQNTILVHAANTLACLKGLPQSPQAIEHRARASQMLLEHFRDYAYDTSDAAISATLSAAAMEDSDLSLERRPYAWVHWRAAVQKIRDRGGPLALVQQSRLRLLINWFDYTFSGYNAEEATFYFDHQSSLVHSGTDTAELVAKRETAHQCEEFLTFLRCAEHLALVHAGMKRNPLARKQQALRHSAFEPDQALFKLLTNSNGLKYTNTGQLKQVISRLAALLTINTAIWEYRHSANISEEFLVELCDNINYNGIDQHLSVEELLQILLSDSKRPALLHTERPWFVGRMLKIAKRLGRQSFEKLNDVLMQWLTLPVGLRPTMQKWEDELRLEILQAPLVSFALPFMQEPA